MKIEFLKSDAEKILHDAFCNGGLSELNHSGIEIEWDSEINSNNYSNAKKRLQESGMTSICIEDVYIEILKNGDCIQFTDFQEDELINLDINNALSNFNSLKDEEKMELAKFLDEDDFSTDAWDCFNALQYAFFGKIIFG